MNNNNLLVIFFNLAIVQNFIVAQFLGLCPFFGVTKKLSDAVAMGLALTSVMMGSAAIAWVLTYYILVPLNMVYMSTVIYILLIATLVQLVEMFIKRTNATLYNAFGIYLPLITVNCAVLGITVINLREKFSLIQSVTAALGGAVGFILVMAIMAGIREKLNLADPPKSTRGLPVAIFVAMMLGLTFFGFGGIV
ncbi:MAG: Rnf-Nqr domain containing protein [Chloroflexota bacterium]